MVNSDDELLMEFKVEQDGVQFSIFDTDSSTTISATEVDNDACESTIPPLFWKIKKPRVLIKKIPQHVLSKYKFKSTKQSLSLSHPSRSSGRLKGKRFPSGQYLALHVNKPLHKILNKKARLKAHQIKTAKKERQRNLTQNKKTNKFGHKPNSSIERTLKSSNLSDKVSSNVKTTTTKNILRRKTSVSTRRNFKDKILPTTQMKVNKLMPSTSPHTSDVDLNTRWNTWFTRQSLHDKILPNQIKGKKLIPPILPNTPDIDITSRNTSPNRHRLNDKIATRIIKNSPVISTLPNCPDVITRYDIPTNSLPNSRNSFLFGPQHNINVQDPSPFGSTNFLQTQSSQPPRGLPKLITPSESHHQIPCQSVVFNAATNASSVSLYPPSKSTPRTFTIQAFKIPHDLSASNIPVAVDSQNVLIIKQPSSSDPLDISSSNATNKVLSQDRVTLNHQIFKDSDSDSETISCFESESDMELSDTEKQKETKVIKRTIYQSKSVQTKFTCNSSICGLVDSNKFNLNCFYCYDIFPLHKWFEFKEHLKFVHHVEEKENQLDSDADNSNYKSQDHHQINPFLYNNVTKNLHPISKSTCKNVNCIPQGINTTEQVFKKLPLEPRLVAQRANKMYISDVKVLSSTPKTSPHPSIQLDQTGAFGKSARRKLSNDMNSSFTDEIISLNSDDCELDMEGIEDETKTARNNLQTDKTTANNKSYLNNGVSRINDVKIVVPSLPHITVKKVNGALPKESINTQKPASELSCLKQSIMKLPFNLNKQKVIKTSPKPTAQELSANGRTKPRYYVVEKVIKLATKSTAPNLKGMVFPILQEPGKGNTKMNYYDDIPTNDENEDSVPKPTNGYGILFGVTNSMVVIEFLLKLKTFPELWRSKSINNVTCNYNGSIKKLCFHLNSRFDLNITGMEMLQSIERVKDWYYRMLKNIYEHNKNPKNAEPYKHKFPIYFKILQNFLMSDDQDANTHLDSSQFKLGTNVKNEIACNTGTLEPIEHFNNGHPITMSSATPLVTPTDIDNNQNTDMDADSLIEFYPDTWYGNESSDEEVLEEFDQDNNFNKKSMVKKDGQMKKRTKVYLGSYECDICRKIFKRSCDLKRHKVLHFPPEFECDTCAAKFHYKHSAEKCSHLKNKSRYKRVDKDPTLPKRIWPKKIFRFKLICEICGASYRSIGSLNTHKKDKHLNQRDRCVVCNFTAPSNWRIVQHQRKRHIVEPGTLEEIARKSRARTDTKTPFSNEARQEFDWRREMRKKLKPGEIFYGCSRCRIIFNSRKEKVLHNKIEHPITEFTVICLLCLPNNMQLLSNSNCARRHYTDIHKVAWHEIDGLLKRTKPIFSLLSKEETEVLKASANYKELLKELLTDKKLELAQSIQTVGDESLEADESLPTLLTIKEPDEEVNQVDVEYTQEEKVYVDGIIDHDYNCGETYASNKEHNYNEEKEINENYDDYDGLKNEFCSSLSCDDGIVHLAHDIESDDNKIYNYYHNNQEYVKSVVDDFVEDELVEESIVVEEYIDEVVDEEEEYIKTKYF